MVSKMNTLNQFELGYLVGILAGEGMIGVFKRDKGLVHAKVEVFNTEPALLYDIQNMVGLGKVYLNTTRRSEKHRRSLFWRVSNYDVVPLLDLVIPGLEQVNSAKAEQAKLTRAYAIMYQRDYRNGRAGMTKKLCPCEINLRQSYINRISDLKHLSYMCDI